MELFTKIAQSLAAIHPNCQVTHLDIQWNYIKRTFIAYVSIDNIDDDLNVAEYEIQQDGRFYKI